MSSTALTTQGAPSAPSLHNFSREQIDTIKNTVAKGATDSELEMFLALAGRYGLDPFAKEIWCHKYVKQGQDPQTVAATIMVSRDGYLKAAQLHPDFEGIKSFVVKEGDHFEIDPMADTLTHKFGAKRGKILGAWAICYRKGRKPVMCFVDFDEYKGTSPIWSNYPSAMIQKVAEVFVLKRQFGINGLVSKEEVDYNLNDDVPMLERATGEIVNHPAALSPSKDPLQSKHQQAIPVDVVEMITQSQGETIGMEWQRVFGPNALTPNSDDCNEALLDLEEMTSHKRRQDLTKAEAAEYITRLQTMPTRVA